MVIKRTSAEDIRTNAVSPASTLAAGVVVSALTWAIAGIADMMRTIKAKASALGLVIFENSLSENKKSPTAKNPRHWTSLSGPQNGPYDLIVANFRYAVVPLCELL
jgi:hypothetical protein